MDTSPHPGRAQTAIARRRRRAALSGTASILLHGAALMLLWGSASGDLMGAAAAAGGGPAPMSVSVVSAADVGLAPRAARPDLRFTPLIAENGSDAPPIMLPPKTEGSHLAALMQRLQADAMRPWAQPADTPRRSAERIATAAAPLADPGEAGTASPGATSGPPGSTGALWGKVEPCWRNLAARAAVPVTLEIAVDRTGGVSTPPKVIRGPDATIDERRLRSEALAVTALAGCMPRGDLRFSGRVFRLDFAPQR